MPTAILCRVPDAAPVGDLLVPEPQPSRPVSSPDRTWDGMTCLSRASAAGALPAARASGVEFASPRLEALILGFGDLSGSMGMRFGHELDKDYRYPGDMWSAHRVRMIAACRAAGIDAIDRPFGDFKNDRAYMKQATYAAPSAPSASGASTPTRSRSPTTSSRRRPGRSGRPRRWSTCTTSRWRRGPGPAARAGSWWMRRRCGSMSRCWSGRGLRGGCRGGVSRSRTLQATTGSPPSWYPHSCLQPATAPTGRPAPRAFLPGAPNCPPSTIWSRVHGHEGGQCPGS